jgi:hypothetical protein
MIQNYVHPTDVKRKMGRKNNIGKSKGKTFEAHSLGNERTTGLNSSD